MNKLAASSIALVFATMSAGQTMAQTADQPRPIATLEVEKGVIMTSTGGEFVTSTTGEKLISGERLMIAKDSVATVVYNDHCRRTYDEPGVFKIDAECKVVAGWGGGAKAAAIIGGAILVGVVVDNNNGGTTPVSH